VIELQAGLLVTLGDCHLLDSLVACDLYCEARKEIVRGSEEDIVRGTVPTLRETRKATLVEVRCEDRQVVWLDLSVRALV
jgi:hypothetical protein